MTIQTLFNRPSISGADDIENFAMANCLMILSSQQQNAAVSAANTTAEISGRMFTCKTCGRKFSSFQALGGHRASHKKIKPPTSLNSGEDSDEKTPSPVKPKTHACTICGLEFPIGQALGGHMRRHRPLNHVSNGSSITTDGLSTEKSDGNNHNNNNSEESKKRKSVDDLVTVPFLKKSSSCKRVCLDLDLNLSLSLPLNKKIEQEEKEVADHHHDSDLEEGEIVEQEKEEEKEERDFLKLELRQPINWAV